MRFFSKNVKIFILVLVCSFGGVQSISSEKTNANDHRYLTFNKHQKPPIESVFDKMHLYTVGLSRKAFDCAIHGFTELKEGDVLKNDSVITILDFDQPSYKKRMYVIDLKNEKMLFNTWVAHGKNTGNVMAEFFSNRAGSLQTSLGLYITDETYQGENGISLKLIGLDDTNFNAEERSIVLHGADYVSQQTINASGSIGRSWGCPAVSRRLCKPIIDKIKGGSCFFIYNHHYPSGNL